MRSIDVLTEATSPRLVERVTAQLPGRYKPRIIAVEDDGSGLPVLERTPVPLPPDTLYRIARQTADEWADSLQTFHPGIFTDLLPGVDLRPAYVVSVTLRLGQVVLPRLISYLDQTKRRVALVDFGLDELQVFQIERLLRRRRRPRKVLNLAAVSSVAARKEAELIEAAGEPAAATSASAPGGVLALVGTTREVRSLGAVLDALVDQPVTVMPKTSEADAVRGAELLARDRAATVITLDEEQATSSGLAVAAALQNLQGRFTKEEPGDPLIHTRLAPLLRMLRHAMTLRAAVERMSPRVIVGSLDRTPTAALLDPVVIDVQHGTLLPFHIADLLHIDVALVWNDASRDALTAEARGKIGHVEVVGNAVWDALAGADPSIPEDLREWASRHSVVAYFPQPGKGAYLTQASVALAERLLVDAVASIKEAALLIKLRSREEMTTFDTGPLTAEGRVRVVSDEEVPLAAVLHVAKAAASIYSTALADARAAGVPAISIDPTGAIEAFGLDFADEVTFCHTTDDFTAALRKAIERGPTPTTSDRAFPRFGDPYPTRVRDALRRANGPVTPSG